MKNTVILVGFVGNNPEIRATQSGASITTVSLATTRSFKDGEGNRQSETEWHRITCFNGVGKCVAEHVAKGAMIMVTGRIHYTKWTDQNGTDRYGCEIIAEQVDFLAKAKEATKDEPKKRRSSSAATSRMGNSKWLRNDGCGAISISQSQSIIASSAEGASGRVL
ncbi:MAG: single-stranded DNA-binding protein [Sphingomonadales bacterium]|nr:single-stranded DNA-binding protein [Sphingomonadales bacterium]